MQREPKHAKHVEALMPSRWCGRGVASSGVVLITWPWFKITKSVTRNPQLAEQCDVNIQSLLTKFLLVLTQRKFWSNRCRVDESSYLKTSLPSHPNRTSRQHDIEQLL
ncbi:hypothetical protein TNCV_2416931 [Trichonephila clavipes]|nr:hypothetical protein TNCV_2416931 [Trichonephila clavipes]